MMSIQEMTLPDNGADPPVEAGLSLGSNIGDRLAHLRNAVQALTQVPGINVLAASPIYETEPVGVKPQYRHMAYLNAVLILSSPLSPEALSECIHRIETDLGRQRQEDRFAPRTIDIDLLYVGNEVRQGRDLTLPHPRWAKRRFVLQPLADVRPTLRIPGSNQTVLEWLHALPADSENVQPIADPLLQI